jgi:carnosine N-methyltransferase
MDAACSCFAFTRVHPGGAPQGYAAQGNEFSYFMLLMGAYLLNGVERELQWTIHPWVHNSCNQASREDQLRGVQVPDIHPAMLVPRGWAQEGGWALPVAHTRCPQRHDWSCAAPDDPSALTSVLPVDWVTFIHSDALLPSNSADPGLLSMSAGDFQDVYARPEYGASFDAVAACFFLDCAHNILHYLDICWHCLKVQGSFT